jgi:hypothetical protein
MKHCSRDEALLMVITLRIPSPRLQANRQLRELREIAKGVTKQLPGVIQNATAKIDE